MAEPTFTSQDTLTAQAVVDQIITISSKYTTRNVLLVPDFILPPPEWVGRMVQVKSPTVSISGTGGGAYMQRLSFQIGVFRRFSGDAYGEYGRVTKECNESARNIRIALTDFAGDSSESLAIHLYDSGFQQQAKIVEYEGAPIRDMVWAVFQMWGVHGNDVTTFLTQSNT